MNNILTWCEIPVTDMNRAKAFYAEVIGVKFIDQNMEDMKMAMFETAGPEFVSGALVEADGYTPSKTASTVYLTGGDDLSDALAKAAKLGSEVAIPKTPIGDGETGYFAQFFDCEGNRVGLFSLN